MAIRRKSLVHMGDVGGGRCFFYLIVEGFGIPHITIAKFEGASFFVFLIIDVATVSSEEGD